MKEKLSDLILGLEKLKRITIGEYTIYEKGVSEGTIHIEHESGEGGDFNSAAFHEVVEKFYIDNF